MGLRGQFLKKALYAELNERAEAATSLWLRMITRSDQVA